MKPLIGIPSPRDIPEFLQAIALIHEDKIWAKYYYEFDAYNIIRNFFLEHDEYTHLVIIPDDLIVKPEDFKTLQNTVYTKCYDYPVLSGTCNLNMLPENRDLFICQKRYEDLNTSEGRLTKFEADTIAFAPIQQMAFEGFACAFISRDVVKRVPFEGVYNVSWFDLAFAAKCHHLEIPLMVDTSVRMVHLSQRRGFYERENWGVDILPSKIIYEKVLEEKYEWLLCPEPAVVS